MYRGKCLPRDVVARLKLERRERSDKTAWHNAWCNVLKIQTRLWLAYTSLFTAYSCTSAHVLAWFHARRKYRIYQPCVQGSTRGYRTYPTCIYPLRWMHCWLPVDHHANNGLRILYMGHMHTPMATTCATPVNPCGVMLCTWFRHAEKQGIYCTLNSINISYFKAFFVWFCSFGSKSLRYRYLKRVAIYDVRKY